MFCPKCGNSFPENAKFCSKCGHKIRGVSEINKDDKGRYLLENNKMQKKSGVHHKVRKYALLVASVLCVLIVIIAAYSMNQSRLIYEYNEAFYTATVIEVKKEYKEKITEIVIPQEVKYEGKTYTVARIQHDAFKGCVNLESVEIPNTVVYIGSGAFHECSSLKSIELSNQIKDINDTTSNTADYVLPNSNVVYLTKSDLAGFGPEVCRVARNEIYARHGRIFTDEILKAYFESKSWYHGTVSAEDFSDDVLNEYEIANRDLILEYEKEQGYR